MSRGTLDTASCNSDFGYEVFTLYDRTSQTVLLSCCSHIAVRTPSCTHDGLGSFPFARRYLGNRCFFLFLPVLRCFSSRSAPRMTMYSSYGDCALPQPGFPIQISTDQSLLAAPRGFSQLATSFFGAWCHWHPPCALVRLIT